MFFEVNPNPCFHRARVILFCGVALFFASCSKPADRVEADSEKKKVVAKLFDKEVYASDIHDVLGAAKGRKDSSQFVRTYLDKIALEKALLHKALGSGLVDMSDIEAKTNEFRNTLINLRYEKEYIKKNLDTVLTKQQLKEYYERNKISFVLNHEIFRGYYVVVPATVPRLEKLKEIMSSDKPHDFEELKSLCLRYASTFSIDPNLWMALPPALKGNGTNLHGAAGSKHILSFEKEDYLYLVRVFDYKFANQQSPVEYVEENIKQILLNKRKIELLGKLSVEALDEARQNNKIEIY